MRRVIAFASAMFVSSSADGGEGGALAALNANARTYRLMSVQTDRLNAIDTANFKERYVAYAYQRYKIAEQQARVMSQKIRAFLAEPTSANLASARAAWKLARPAYLHTEVFRYYDGPIDAPALSGSEAGPESRINAWPLNEVVIDQLIANSDRTLTAQTIKLSNQVTDENDVTTGWHAIEFLLWGADVSKNGPGNRAASDFRPGNQVRDRRRTYLASLLELLEQDLAGMVIAWDPSRPDGYSKGFIKLESYEALGRILTGAGSYAGLELASERLTVALDSQSQEDEHSCFSDTTTADHHAGVQAIVMLFSREGGGVMDVLESVDKRAASDLAERIRDADAAVKRLYNPFDSILSSAPNSRKRLYAENYASSLVALAKQITLIGRSAGVMVSVPGI